MAGDVSDEDTEKAIYKKVAAIMREYPKFVMITALGQVKTSSDGNERVACKRIFCTSETQEVADCMLETLHRHLGRALGLS